jgi:hypothetical protein
MIAEGEKPILIHECLLIVCGEAALGDMCCSAVGMMNYDAETRRMELHNRLWNDHPCFAVVLDIIWADEMMCNDCHITMNLLN